MLFHFFIAEVLFIFLMVAHFVGIDSEAAGFACRHEFAALLEEIYQLGSRHSFCRASAEPLFGTETFYNGIDELLFCCVTIALHHVEHFMSMCHIYNVYSVACFISSNQHVLSWRCSQHPSSCEFMMPVA